jgi:hypothetical protein
MHIQCTQRGLKVDATAAMQKAKMPNVRKLAGETITIYSLLQKRIMFVYIVYIIEQVTDSKYLGYCISEYRSDLEDKLQTYNKINRAIWRYFGKQMNKETKLRIHNITAKAALKFGSDAWVLKKREEQRLEAVQMKILRHLLGITRLDKISINVLDKKWEHGTE